MKEIIESLMAVIDALNNIEVKGEINLDKMLGSIQELRRVIAILSKKEEKNG